MVSPIRYHRLVPRGTAGLACDDDGVAFGPVTLIEPMRNGGEKVLYRCIAEPILSDAIQLAYGRQTMPDMASLYASLRTIAELMSTGQHALARIAAVQTSLAEYSLEALTDSEEKELSAA